jgi:hypothetical protein
MRGGPEMAMRSHLLSETYFVGGLFLAAFVILTIAAGLLLRTR